MTQRALTLTQQRKWFEGRHVCQLCGACVHALATQIPRKPHSDPAPLRSARETRIGTVPFCYTVLRHRNPPPQRTRQNRKPEPLEPLKPQTTTEPNQTHFRLAPATEISQNHSFLVVHFPPRTLCAFSSIQSCFFA